VELVKGQYFFEREFRVSKTVFIRLDKVEIYVHFIWTTYDRHPLISPELEGDLYPIIHEMVQRHNAKMLAIGGMPDHVHLLTKFSSTTVLWELVKDAKGVSSNFMNARLGNFKWRPTYAAFSVSRWDVRRIANYIERQKEHHSQGTILEPLESA
jgi:REP element-mobilizing transposase RayT